MLKTDYILEYDDELHRYFLDGEEIISCTQVFDELGIIDKTYFTPEHAKRGSSVHYMAEKIDLNEPYGIPPAVMLYPHMADELNRYAIQWLRLREENALQFTAIEEKVFDPHHFYAARLDRAFTINAPCVDLAIGEIKTNRSGYVPKWTKWQLAGQAHAKYPNEIVRRFVFVLTPERYILHELPIEEFVSDRDDFLAMVRSARAIRSIR